MTMYFLLACLLQVYAIFFCMHIIAHWVSLKVICTTVINRQESPQVAGQRFSQELGSFMFIAIISSLDSMVVAAQLALHILNQAVDWVKVQTNYETLVNEANKEPEPVFPPIDPRKES